ncbi:5731_t:CDS:2, partial [Gigaspora margarita]
MSIQDSSDLTVEDFFKLSFGLTPIELDSTKFVTNEFTYEVFTSLIEPSLKKENPSEIFRNLFPYLVDTISRTIPIANLVNYIQEFNENNEFDDTYQILRRFEEFCTGRDFLIAFLDVVPQNSFLKILNTLVAANIPLPIYLSNDTHSQKGLKILNGIRDIIVARNYKLFLSVNQANNDYLETPFTKQLYKTYSMNREDCSGICNPNSIDISFHAASENRSRPPLAISEVYYDEPGSSILNDTVKILSKFAFYIVIHVSNNDFDGNEFNDKFISTINDISPQSFSKRKEKIEKLLRKKFTNDEPWIELVINNKKNALFEKLKKDSFYKLKNIDNPWLDWTSMNISKILENDFSSMAKLDKFTCRADIFHASYCENEIETLRDKTHFKTSEDAQCYQTYSEILTAIQNFENEQKNIGDARPILVLSYFADIIKKNNIKYMREFARQADVYFKNLDITIHDFWRELVILSQIMRHDDSTVLKKLYNISNKQLEKAYSIWICEGEAIQILEGVSLRTLNSDFLSSVL